MSFDKKGGRPTESAHNDIIHIVDPNLRHGFAQVPRPILKARSLSDKAKIVYALLLDYAWQTGSCFPGQQKLAEDLTTSERTIRRALEELRDNQLVSWKQRGLSQTNIYYILNLAESSISDSEVSANVPDRTKMAAPDRTKMAGQHQTKMAAPDRTPLTDKEYPDQYTQKEKYTDSTSNIRKRSYKKEKEGENVDNSPRPQRYTPNDTASDIPAQAPRMPQMRAKRRQSTNPSAEDFQRSSDILTHPVSSHTMPTAPSSEVPLVIDNVPHEATSARGDTPPLSSQNLAVPAEAQHQRKTLATAAKSYSTEDRTVIGAYLKDYTWKLHDKAPLRSSISRALNLFVRAQPCDRQAFIDRMYEAYRLTQETAGIRSASKMPYFFSVLEDLVGLKPADPEGDAPASTAEPSSQHTAYEQQRQSLLGSYRDRVKPTPLNDHAPPPAK